MWSINSLECLGDLFFALFNALLLIHNIKWRNYVQNCTNLVYYAYDNQSKTSKPYLGTPEKKL